MYPVLESASPIFSSFSSVRSSSSILCINESVVVIVVCVPDLWSLWRLGDLIAILGDWGMVFPVGSLISRRMDIGDGFGEDMVGREDWPIVLLKRRMRKAHFWDYTWWLMGSLFHKKSTAVSAKSQGSLFLLFWGREYDYMLRSMVMLWVCENLSPLVSDSYFSEIWKYASFVGWTIMSFRFELIKTSEFASFPFLRFWNQRRNTVFGRNYWWGSLE